MRLIFSIVIVQFFVFSLQAQRAVSYKHANGQKKESGTLLEGEKDGRWMEWNQKGVLIKEIEYSKGNKLYEKRYSSKGLLHLEIDFYALEDLAFIKTYNYEGVCWLEHYFVNRNARVNSEWKLGYRMAYHTENGKRHYFTHTNKALNISLPHYWWDGEGKLVVASFGTNTIHWHSNGYLRQVKGYFDASGKDYYYRWDEAGNRVNSSLKIIADDTVNFTHSLGRDQLRKRYAEGLPHGKWKNYYANGQLWYVQQFKKGVPVGDFEAYYFDGKPHVKASLKQGLFHGEYSEWYPSGKLKMTGIVDLGRKDGAWKFWNKEGMLLKEEIYLNRKLHGITRKYHHQSGDLILEENYINGKGEGRIRKWYDGNILKMSSYRNKGYASGRVLEYHENGQLKADFYEGFGIVRKYHATAERESIGYRSKDNGNTFTGRWDKDGVLQYSNYHWGKGHYANVAWPEDFMRLESIQYFVNKVKRDPEEMLLHFLRNRELEIREQYEKNGEGLKHGLGTVFYPNGQKWAEENYSQGQLHGTSRIWSIGGQLLEEGNFTHGIRDGSFKMWGHEGKSLSEEHYKNGQREGKWQKWHPASEQLKSEKTYQNGKLNGVRIHYNPDGSTNQYVTYKDDKYHGIYQYHNYKKRYKAAEYIYKNGERDGLAMTFNELGHKEWVGYFVKGKQHGQWKKLDARGHLIESKYYDYGEQIVEPLGLSCQCEVNYGLRSKVVFFPLLRHLASYEEVEKITQKHFVLDKNIYEYLFYRNIYFDNNGSSSGFVSMDLIGLKSVNFEFLNLPDLKINLNPCLREGQYSDAHFSVRYSAAIDSASQKSWKVNADIKRLAIDFPLTLLKQWNPETQKAYTVNGRELGARLLLGVERLSFTTEKGIDIEDPHDFCFTESMIGNTNVTLRFDNAKIEIEEKSIAKSEAIFKFYNQYTDGKTAGILVPKASGTMYFDKKSIDLTFKSILIKGELIIGTILLDKSDLENKFIIKQAKKQFSVSQKTGAGEDEGLYFVYRKPQ